jgi:hypothetical protein
VIFSEIERAKAKPEIVKSEVLFYLGVEMNIVFLTQVNMVPAIPLLVGFKLSIL